MSLELSGTTPAIKGVAGSVSAPAITGDDADTGISFPSANTIKFSTGGVERISITDSGISGTGIAAGGKFASYAIIGDQKSADSDAGTFTSGAWRIRDLNAEIADPDGIVSISSNQFTLAAGSYLVKASAPAIGVNNHKIKIYNVTDSADVEIGTTEYAHASDYTGERSFVAARFTISGSKAFEIRHRCETTKSTYGLGRGYGMSVVELFTLVEIYKES
jgi:hypothetical protein